MLKKRLLIKAPVYFCRIAKVNNKRGDENAPAPLSVGVSVPALPLQQLIARFRLSNEVDMNLFIAIHPFS